MLRFDQMNVPRRRVNSATGPKNLFMGWNGAAQMARQSAASGRIKGGKAMGFAV